MSDRSLPLLIQSCQDALEDCRRDLDQIHDRITEMVSEGAEPPLPPDQVELAQGQCRRLLHTLQSLARRL